MKLVVSVKKQLQRLNVWIQHHRKTSLVIGGLLAIAITGGTTLAIFYQQPVPEKIAEIPAPKPKKKEPAKPKPVYYSALTGEEVPNKAAITKPVTAVMIENSPDARPQSGLGQAEVVYEAIAEGGITRFLALYQQHKPNLIGPVRSVRMYYIDWLAPYNASVAHVGGSFYALQEIRNGKYRDIDQFFNAGTYWRSTDRYAPHNVYTNSKNLDALNAAKGYTTSNPAGIPRASTRAAAKSTATHVAIHISGPLYDSTYDYDKKTNLYSRSQAGAPHNDTESGQIKTRVVAVIKTDLHPVMEDGIREDYRTVGTGEAWVFQDGVVHKATWHKQDRLHQLFFTGEDGKSLPLARGTTWITAISSDGGVSWQ